MFQKTSDYLYGEITTTQDNYNLVEKLNTITITKYSDMKQMSSNIAKTIEDYNIQYVDVVQPLLQQIDEIEEKIAKFEEVAYRMDNITKQLVLKFKNLEKSVG
ncbi:Biogenesis of lysosome-related organelles complex 1 subunit 2 [Eumeta japonica]|uniref:Biogenesis of lysosome-related organelles complex 1 subunit 2 n=1 Tax=Eumeta variegata TaxID=151549 RepID=A0A4C2A356_EUMVA|nr:Biogenesis of lysosome-related organelles complex 1 subunit 2 [Eumeta japonica]